MGGLKGTKVGKGDFCNAHDFYALALPMTGKWLICSFYSADACAHVASARCAGRANRFDAVEYSSELKGPRPTGSRSALSAPSAAQHPLDTSSAGGFGRHSSEARIDLKRRLVSSPLRHQ
ncbi:hypothetical protein D3C81_1664100 [compost metagenome]